MFVKADFNVNIAYLYNYFQHVRLSCVLYFCVFLESSTRVGVGGGSCPTKTDFFEGFLASLIISEKAMSGILLTQPLSVPF